MKSLRWNESRREYSLNELERASLMKLIFVRVSISLLCCDDSKEADK